MAHQATIALCCQNLDRQAFSAFAPAVCQHASSANGRTSFAEAVHTFSFNITGLKSPFHKSILKIILQNAKNPALLSPNQMVRQPEGNTGRFGGLFHRREPMSRDNPYGLISPLPWEADSKA